MSQPKAEELSYLINLGMQNLLKPIEFIIPTESNVTEDLRKAFREPKTTEMSNDAVNSKVVVSLCNNS